MVEGAGYHPGPLKFINPSTSEEPMKDSTKTTEAARHTPGPWHAYSGLGVDVVNADEGRIEVVELRSQPPDTRVANARLIAAAPDMLEVCEELLKAYNIDICDAIAYKPAVEMARAAIAKARGQ